MLNRQASYLYTIEHRRAKKAEELAKGTKEYKSAAQKLPSMIINCGLLQTIAFYKAKGDNEGEVYSALEKWLKEEFNIQNSDLIDYIINLPVPDYRVITREALAFSIWLKRFSEIKYKELEAKKKGE